MYRSDKVDTNEITEPNRLRSINIGITMSMAN